MSEENTLPQSLNLAELRDLRNVELIREMARSVGVSDDFHSAVAGASAITEALRTLQAAAGARKIYHSQMCSETELGKHLNSLAYMRATIEEVIYCDGHFMVIASQGGEK